MRQLFSLLILLCCCAPPLAAQPAVKKGGARRFVFTHLSSTTGLAANVARSIAQDRDGYIWIATINGLQRYDGHSLQTFRHRPGDTASLPHDHVTQLWTDRKGRLWVATLDNRVGVFDPRSFRYRPVRVAYDFLAPTYLEKAFKETPEGAVVLDLPGHSAYLLDEAKATFFPHRLFPMPPGWKRMNWSYQPETDQYWIAADSGLAMYNRKTGHLNYRGHNPDRHPAIKAYEHLIFLSDVSAGRSGRLLISSWARGGVAAQLDYYNLRTGQRRTHSLGSEAYGLGYYTIRGFAEQRNGRQWVFGYPVLVAYTGEPEPFIAIPNEYAGEQSIRFDEIFCLFEDRDQNLWIGTDNGLYLFNPDHQLFQNYNLVRPDGGGAVEGPMQSALQLQDGQLWVGTWGRGLYCYDREMRPIAPPRALEPYKDYLNTWCILQHRQTGQVWMGLQGGELMIYDPATGVLRHLSPEAVGGATIRQFTEDRAGNIWIGTHNGKILRWKPGTDPQTGLELILKGGTVGRLMTAHDGTVWAATSTGLLQLDPVSGRVVRTFRKNGPPGTELSMDDPQDVLEYDDTTVLAACGAVDVINTRTGKVRHLTVADGLPAATAVCLRRDQNGIVWAGLSSGLCRINLQRRTFTPYDRRDGIVFDNFDQAGAYTLAAGRLLFTTSRNFLIFDPGQLGTKAELPRVLLTNLSLGDEAVPADSLARQAAVTVPYDNSALSIAFSALRYLNREKVGYQYRLKGLDKDWKSSGFSNKVGYPYLPAGHYTFEVRTVNEDGSATGPVTSVPVYVRPPFWRTWPFYALLLLAIAGIIFLIDQERIRRLKALAQIRKQIADDLHQELHTTLSNINTLSEIARIKADKEPERSKEFIGQIQEKSSRMIVAMDDILWSIAPENDSMEASLARMKEYIDALRRQCRCDISLVIDNRVKQIVLDMNRRHQFFLIFKETVRAFIDYGGGYQTGILLDLQDGKLALKIRDESAELDLRHPEVAAFLAEVQQRAHTAGGELDLHSDRHGTAAILLLPVR